MTDWGALDKEVVWHPFTQMMDWMAQSPLVIESGEGPYLFDTDGNRYIDGVSSLWTNVHGHRHPVIDKAIREQLDRVGHSTLLGLASVPSVEFARRLLEVVPSNLTRVFYSDNGSTATEVALKIAFHYCRQPSVGTPGRTKFLSFKEAYHGDTIGSVSAGGIDLFHETYRPMLFDAFHAPYATGKTLTAADVEAVEAIFREHAGEIGAVIIEPLVQGAAGIRVAPPGFLRAVRELCDRYGALLICDEVATGFGRTGKMFACEHEDVQPDLMCLAKGITGGYLPLAATLATERVFEAFLAPHEEFRQFFHGHTYTGNPLACAAGIASLDVFEQEKVLESLPAKCEALAAALEPIAALAHVRVVRNRGLMTGVELVRDKAAGVAYDPAEKAAIRVVLEARKHGLIIRPLGDTIVLMPPLCASPELLAEICEITALSIRTVLGE